MTASEYVEREVEQRRLRLEAALEAALTNAAPDHVHITRTSWRRLETAIEAFPWFLKPKDSKLLTQRMKELMRCAAELRDRDIAHGKLKQYKGLALILEGERLLFTPAYREAIKHVLPLELARSKRLPRRASQDVRTMSHALLEHSQEQLLAELEKLQGQPYSRLWHRFRVLSKKHRYLLEFFAPLSENRQADRIAKIKFVQDELGSLEDLAATLRWLENIQPRESCKHIRKAVAQEFKARSRNISIDLP